MEEYVNIGNLDIDKYKDITDKQITTTEVIITYKQIKHINEKEERDFSKYESKLKSIIENPDYIIKDTKHKDTGLIVKKFDSNIIVVIKLETADMTKKNSIITIWEIKDKRLERYLLTHKTVYKKE